MRIGLDIDGVLADFTGHFFDYLGIKDKSLPKDWNDIRFTNNFHKIANDQQFWEGIPALVKPESLDFIPVIYVTAREIPSEVSKKWLDKKGFPDAPVITVGTNGNKVEALLGKVNEGDDVEVSFSSINKNVKGKIIQTGQYIDPMNRTFKIKIDLAEQNSLFKPNLLAVIKITDYKATDAVVVPNKTVQDDIKGNFVFVNENGIASKKYVTLGNSNQISTEILEGLEGTESIITKGNKGLIKGEKLNIVQ